MILKKFGFLVFALTMVLAVGSCSKKAPEDVASGDEPMVSDTSEMMDEGDTSGLEDAGTSMDVGLPTVYFDYNESTIRSDTADMLQQAAESLKMKAGVQITIEGHCDERGSTEYNLALGERRARSVKSYLRSLGIDGQGLSTISYGEERPSDFGHGENAWAKNRRAELIVNQ